MFRTGEARARRQPEKARPGVLVRMTGNCQTERNQAGFRNSWLPVCLLLLAGMLRGGRVVGDDPPKGMTSLGDSKVRFEVPTKEYAILRRDGWEVVIVDNRAVSDGVLPGHRAGYHGVAAIRHARQPRSPFVPAYSGLNFEHIHDGTVQSRDVLFEPRRAPMELRVIGSQVVELYQAPTPFWGLESCARYELLEDGVIGMTFECIPRRDAFRNGYCGLFWASYIDQPASLDIHFRGHTGAGGGARWIRGSTPEHGVAATHRPAGDEREWAHEPAFPLELPFGFSRHRPSEPWYFGICRGVALVQAFRATDRVWFSQSPSGGGQDCPAWDFQWHIARPQVGRLYQLRMRLLSVLLDSPEALSSCREQVTAAVARARPD